MDHPLQVPALFLRSPLEPLVDDDIMKYKIEYSVSEDAQGYRDHVGVVMHLGEVIEQANRRQAEYQCEQIIFLQGMVMHSMMRLMPSP